MSFSRADVLALTSPPGRGWLVGEVAWAAINDSWRGEAFVGSDLFAFGQVKFVLNLANRNEPTFVLMIRGRHCWRVDINTPHRHLPGTHLQETDASGCELSAVDARALFPPIPLGGTVGGEQYRAAFLAFAKHLNIETAGLTWIDPPEGRPT